MFRNGKTQFPDTAHPPGTFLRAMLKTLCRQSTLLEDTDVPEPTGEPGALTGKQSAWNATLSAVI